MTRKEKKLYEQMRQYQPPEVETEKLVEMQKKSLGNRKRENLISRVCLRESGSRQNICQSGFGLRKESFLWQEFLTQTADKGIDLTFGSFRTRLR